MRITAEDVEIAVAAQNERGTPEVTADLLDYDETGVAAWAESMSVPMPGIFAGAISLGIEIERARHE